MVSTYTLKQVRDLADKLAAGERSDAIIKEASDLLHDLANAVASCRKDLKRIEAMARELHSGRGPVTEHLGRTVIRFTKDDD
jgi:hypothetical protein